MLGPRHGGSSRAARRSGSVPGARRMSAASGALGCGASQEHRPPQPLALSSARACGYSRPGTCPWVRAGPRPTHAGHGSHASSPTPASVPVRPASGAAAQDAPAQDAPGDRGAGLAGARSRLALLRLHDRARAGSAAVRGGPARPAVERRDLRRRRQDGSRSAALGSVPRARQVEPDRARDAQRRGLDRGPALLHPRRHRPGRHGARRGRQHLDGHAGPGRLDDHPAARQEPLAPGAGRAALGAAQDHRGGARLPGRAALVEAEDPRGVPQHDLLRASGLRRRGGRGGLLRRPREEPAAAPGGAARGARAEPVGQRSGPAPGSRPGSGAGSCSASCSSRATSTSSSTASPTPSRSCRAAGRSASRPRRRRSRATSSTTSASS